MIIQFNLENIEHIIMRQEDELLRLLYEVVEGKTDFETLLSVELEMKYESSGFQMRQTIHTTIRNFKIGYSHSALEDTISNLINEISSFEYLFERKNY